jgi:peroxiredoxin
MPSVQRVHDDFAKADLVFLAASVDASASPVESYLQETGFTIPVVLDKDAAVARRFGVVGTPTTFLISRDGNIVTSSYGPLDFDSHEFRRYLAKLISDASEPERAAEGTPH